MGCYIAPTYPKTMTETARHAFEATVLDMSPEAYAEARQVIADAKAAEKAALDAGTLTYEQEANHAIWAHEGANKLRQFQIYGFGRIGHHGACYHMVDAFKLERWGGYCSFDVEPGAFAAMVLELDISKPAKRALLGTPGVGLAWG